MCSSVFRTIFGVVATLTAVFVAHGVIAQEKPRVKVTISKETTVITEPLRSDGYPDYLRYLDERLSKGVTAQNNAAVLLWQAMGPKEISEDQRAEFFKKLGVPPVSESDAAYISWSAFHEKLHGKLPAAQPNDGKTPEDLLWKRHERAMRAPWTAKDDPDMAEWLRRNDKAIALFVEASMRSEYYCPTISAGEPPLISALFPTPNVSREAARILAVHAMLGLGEGRRHDAWRDVMAIYHLARLVGRGPTLVDYLVSIAIEGIAAETAIQVWHRGNFTADELQTMQIELSKLPAAPKAAEKLDLGERLSFLDTVSTIARVGPVAMRNLVDGGLDSARKRGLLDLTADLVIDWDVPLREGNNWYDRLVAVLNAPTKAERNTGLQRFENDVKEFAGSVKKRPPVFETLFTPRKLISEKIGGVLVALFLPALTAVASAEDRSATKQTLVELAIALERNRAEHGRYPDRLDALAPGHIPKIDNDSFADRPLVYLPTEKGYLLYSFGQNGKDDGGRSIDHDDGSDDIVVATPDATKRPQD